MKKFRTLKIISRILIPRNLRCHKRRVFFERLFNPLKESDYINCNDETFKDACHEMAADVPFYLFEERSYIEIGDFFMGDYSKLKARIIRKSSLWKLLSGYGKYEVTILVAKRNGSTSRYSYEKTVKL